MQAHVYIDTYICVRIKKHPHTSVQMCLSSRFDASKKKIFVCATKMQMKHFLDIFLVSQSLTELFLEKEA